jgi:hypothetical protein
MPVKVLSGLVPVIPAKHDQLAGWFGLGVHQQPYPSGQHLTVQLILPDQYLHLPSDNEKLA